MRRQDKWLELADRLNEPRSDVVAACALLNLGRSPAWVASALRLNPRFVEIVAGRARPLLRQPTEDRAPRMTGEEVCTYCGSPSELTRDHIEPRSRGGSRSRENIVWACRSCNSAKGARTPEEWLSCR